MRGTVKYFLLVSLLLIPPHAHALEEYLRQNYLEANEKYGHVPVNRFKLAGTATPTKDIPEEVSSWALKNGLLIPDGFSFDDDQIFRVRYLKYQDDSLIGKFYENYVYVSDEATYFPVVEFVTEDLEVGGYSRIVWDIIRRDSKLLVLIFNRIYESHNFELYEANGKSLTLVEFFEFGGL